MVSPIKFPKREMYTRFLDGFSTYLSRDHPNICFFTYGSINNPCEFIPGISDIDGGIILDSRVVTRCKYGKIRDLSIVLKDLLVETGISLDLNLLDRETSIDGRFLSYAQSFTDHIKTSGKVITGPTHFIDGLNGFNYRDEDLVRCAMTLRSLRNRFLFSEYNHETNPVEFYEGVISNVKKVIKLPKQLILVQNRRLVKGNGESRKALEELLPGIDLKDLSRLVGEIRNIGNVSKILNDKDRSIELLRDSLYVAESIIQDYLHRFPYACQKEARFIDERELHSI